jgi:hypothetical protein
MEGTMHRYWKEQAFAVALVLLALYGWFTRDDWQRRDDSVVSPRRTFEEILAYEEVGRPPPTALVARFRVHLDHITKQCRWGRETASDRLLRAHQILEEEGSTVRLLDLTAGLDRATQDLAYDVDCTGVLPVLMVMLSERR